MLKDMFLENNKYVATKYINKKYSLFVFKNFLTFDVLEVQIIQKLPNWQLYAWQHTGHHGAPWERVPD